MSSEAVFCQLIFETNTFSNYYHMKPLRLALVTRRFWPLVGGAEVVMANLASEFLRQGTLPVILTAQWEKQWPQKCILDEVPVVRLPHSARQGWGTLRYMSSLSRWLKNHPTDFDLVYVSMLKHDAYAVMGCLAGSPKPVVLRAEAGGKDGDCDWQRRARFGKRIQARCRQANALVAISPVIEKELLLAGYSPATIHRINDGVASMAIPDEHQQREARKVLAEANPALKLPAGAQLAVFNGRLHPEKGLFDLIRAWPVVQREVPNARLWLVGTGEARPKLVETVENLGLFKHVVFPGVFDSLEEVLLAADLFVLPSYQEGLSAALLEAMAYGLPTVVTDVPGNRVVVQDEETGLIVPPKSPQQLARAISRIWTDHDLRIRLIQAAKQLVRESYSLEAIAKAHLHLFRELISSKVENRVSGNRS